MKNSIFLSLVNILFEIVLILVRCFNNRLLIRYCELIQVAGLNVHLL